MKMKIRNEKKADYREVEELLRDAFWDLYVPGCVCLLYTSRCV